MKQELSILEQALDAANKKGVFGLADASLIAQALSNLNTYFAPVNEVKEVAPEVTKDANEE